MCGTRRVGFNPVSQKLRAVQGQLGRSDLVETVCGQFYGPHVTQSASSSTPSLGKRAARELVLVSFRGSSQTARKAVPFRSIARMMIALW
jgi:hypothetical protein